MNMEYLTMNRFWKMNFWQVVVVPQKTRTTTSNLAF